jgi:hypothetical protein
MVGEGGAAFVVITEAFVVPEEVEAEETSAVEAVVPASKAFRYSRKTPTIRNLSVQYSCL